MKIEKSLNLAEIAISYRIKVKAKDRAKVTSSATTFELLKGIYNDDTVEHHEEFVVMLLNRAMHVLGWVKISQGGIDSTIADPRIVFQHALAANATNIIVSHNHPSGMVVPSQLDKDLTKRLVNGGQLLEIRVLDHIIFTRDAYYSIADEAEM